MEQLPLISFITVVRNGEKVLEGTIKSVISQTYPAREYILVDGDSKDGTINIIKKYKKYINNWISEPDKSHFDAMNKGLKLATGKYVWFINAGDQIYDKYTVQKIFKKAKNADVYFGETALINLKGDKIGMWWRKNPKELTWRKMDKGMVVCHQSFIIRKSLAGKFNLTYPISSDIDWIIRGLKKSKKIINTNLILSKYLTGGLSEQKTIQMFLDCYKIYFKHIGVMRTLANHFPVALYLLGYKFFKLRF